MNDKLKILCKEHNKLCTDFCMYNNCKYTNLFTCPRCIQKKINHIDHQEYSQEIKNYSKVNLLIKEIIINRSDYKQNQEKLKQILEYNEQFIKIFTLLQDAIKKQMNTHQLNQDDLITHLITINGILNQPKMQSQQLTNIIQELKSTNAIEDSFYYQIKMSLENIYQQLAQQIKSIFQTSNQDILGFFSVKERDIKTQLEQVTQFQNSKFNKYKDIKTSKLKQDSNISQNSFNESQKLLLNYANLSEKHESDLSTNFTQEQSTKDDQDYTKISDDSIYDLFDCNKKQYKIQNPCLKDIQIHNKKSNSQSHLSNNNSLEDNKLEISCLYDIKKYVQRVSQQDLIINNSNIKQSQTSKYCNSKSGIKKYDVDNSDKNTYELNSSDSQIQFSVQSFVQKNDKNKQSSKKEVDRYNQNKFKTYCDTKNYDNKIQNDQKQNYTEKKRELITQSKNKTQDKFTKISKNKQTYEQEITLLKNFNPKQEICKQLCKLNIFSINKQEKIILLTLQSLPQVLQLFKINDLDISESIEFNNGDIIDAIMNEETQLIVISSVDFVSIYQYSNLSNLQTLKLQKDKKVVKLEFDSQNFYIEIYQQNCNNPFHEISINHGLDLKTSFIFKEIDIWVGLVLKQNKLIEFIDIENDQILYSVKEKYSLNSIELSQNKKIVATSGLSEIVTIYSYNSEKKALDFLNRIETGHSDEILQTKFINGDTWIITISGDCTWKVFDCKTAQMIYQNDCESQNVLICCEYFQQENKLLFIDETGQLKIYQLIEKS